MGVERVDGPTDDGPGRFLLEPVVELGQIGGLEIGDMQEAHGERDVLLVLVLSGMG